MNTIRHKQISLLLNKFSNMMYQSPDSTYELGEFIEDEFLGKLQYSALDHQQIRGRLIALLLNEDFAKEVTCDRYKITQKGMDMINNGGCEKYLDRKKAIENLPFENQKKIKITTYTSILSIIIALASLVFTILK